MLTETISGIGFGILFFVIMSVLVASYFALIWIIVKRLLDKSAISDYYLKNVVAYKVGLIHKKSKENNIELIYPPENKKDKFINELESDVESDLGLDVPNIE